MIVHHWRTASDPARVGDIVAVELPSPRPHPPPPAGLHDTNVASAGSVPHAATRLATLAHRAGFTLDPDELDVSTAHRPNHIIGWALLAARHDALTCVLTLIDNTITALNELTDHDPGGPDEHQLAHLRRHRRELAHQLDALRREFGRACVAIAADPTHGLLWAHPALAATDPDVPATVHMGGSVPTLDHVVLTHHSDGRLTAHGTYTTAALACTASAEIGFTDDTVAASTTAVLVPPEHTNPEDAVQQHHSTAPDGLLDPQSVSDLPSPVVVLVADVEQARFALVGPFPDQNAGQAWVDRHQHPIVRQHLLALSEQAPGHPDQDTTPRVIVARTAQGCFAYGPFPDALHATAWAHTLAGMLDPRTHSLSLYPVGEPFDFTEHQPARPSAPVRPATTGQSDTYPRHSHVVLLHDDGDQSGLVGFFADLADASNWCLTQRPHLDPTVILTAMPLLAPVTLPAPAPPTR